MAYAHSGVTEGDIPHCAGCLIHENKPDVNRLEAGNRLSASERVKEAKRRKEE